ncbi:serine hydrolase domain-containing protein [Maioricimonas sp. JC845]|uniref:serine hydrolase domain-containing protein n=1 Tax=Maioricimonas sp. JC845 TaxID=3232138 RepID=UPI0034589BD3
MHPILRWIFVGVALVIPSIGDAQEIAEDALQRARAELKRAVTDGEVAGAVHLVSRDSRTVYLEAAGVRDLGSRQPMTPDTIIRIYSMTKPVTSVAAMTLYEQGKFELDDPVSRYIPAFADAKVIDTSGDEVRLVSPRRPITVRDVMRHSTGYNYGGEKAKAAEYYEREQMRYRPPAGMLPPGMTIAEAAEALARIPAEHHPGERFTYGFNTDLLGRLIEVWSGQPFADYMQEAVLTPLDMVDTGFAVPDEKRDRFASCHTTRDGKLAVLDKAEASPFVDGFEFVSGGGGLVSTIRDYGNFCQMLVDGGEFNGRRILKEQTVRMMFTDQLQEAAGDFRFGLGFSISDAAIGTGESRRMVPQYGWGGYASTEFRLVPEKRMYQILVRQHIPYSNELANRLFGIVYTGVE